MKQIVTHISPDLDAVTSVWLLHRFMPGWNRAKTVFVPAGETLNGAPPDSNPNIIHVDTGLGMYDHHQTADKTCAARKIFDDLTAKGYLEPLEELALERMTEVSVRYDHFLEIFLDDPDNDILDYSIAHVINGVKMKHQNDEEVLTIFETLLDGILINFKNKINAEEVIKTGFTFKSSWGKSIALETENDETMKLAMKQGYDLVMRKSPKYDVARIKLHPRVEKRLKSMYEVLQKKDSKATWFYHSSGRMLINGTSKNPDMVPTKLTIKQLVKIAKDLK